MRLELALNQRVYVKKNSKRLIVRGNRKFFVPSFNFEVFHNKAIAEIAQQLPSQALPATPLFKKYTSTVMHFYVPGRTRVDADGMETSMLDILQDARIIIDDNDVVHSERFKHYFAPDFKCTVEINDCNVNGEII